MSLALFIKNSFLHSAMCRRSHHWRSWLQTWFVLAGGEPHHKACALIASNDGQCWGFEYLHLNMFPLYRFECSMWRWTLESIVPKCFSYHWYRLWVGAKLLGQLCCTIHIFNTIFERSRWDLGRLGFEIADVGRSHFSTFSAQGFQKMIQLAEICAKHSDVFGSLKTTWSEVSPGGHLFSWSFACSPAFALAEMCFLYHSAAEQIRSAALMRTSQRVWSPSPTAPIDVWERDSNFVKAIPTGKSVADDFPLTELTVETFIYIYRCIL